MRKVRNNASAGCQHGNGYFRPAAGPERLVPASKCLSVGRPAGAKADLNAPLACAARIDTSSDRCAADSAAGVFKWVLPR